MKTASNVVNAKEEKESKVFDDYIVEKMPAYPGGNTCLMNFLANNIKYPLSAQKKRIQGRVVISFVVERDGSITDVNVVHSVEASLDQEAQRVVRLMPKWIPGMQNGQPVRVKYTVPISFRLD